MTNIITTPIVVPPANPTTTNGWDTVYAIRFPDVNKGIVSKKSSPKNFAQTITDPDMGTISLHGNFGDWQLTNGGDGKNIRISLPISTSTLSFSGKDHVYGSLITAVIEVNLLWLSKDGQPDSTSTTPRKVVLQMFSNTDNEVSVQSIDPGTNTISETQLSFYRTILENWLNGNRNAFEHVFAFLDINAIADTGKEGFQWLKPTDKLYAVVDVDGDATKSIFGVLCMTGNRVSPGAHEISPFAIPANANSGFLIAPERIISDMLLAYIPLMFIKATALDFDITNDNTQITNKNKLQFNQQKMDDGTVIQPEIEAGKFNITVEATYIKMEFTDLHFPWSPGISVHVTHTSNSTFKMTSDRKIKMDVINSTTTGNIQTETWVKVVEIVGSILLSIVGSVGGGFIGGAVKGGTVAVTAATEAVLDGIEMTAVETAENVGTNVALDAAEDAATETTALVRGGTSLPGKFASFFARNWAKLLGGAIGGGVGATIGMIPSIIGAVANGHEDVPTLDEFGTQALQPLAWPNLSNDGLTLVSGELNGAFQMGIQLKEKP
jgi:hypothetical protein